MVNQISSNLKTDNIIINILIASLTSFFIGFLFKKISEANNIIYELFRNSLNKRELKSCKIVAIIKNSIYNELCLEDNNIELYNSIIHYLNSCHAPGSCSANINKNRKRIEYFPGDKSVTLNNGVIAEFNEIKVKDPKSCAYEIELTAKLFHEDIDLIKKIIKNTSMKLKSQNVKDLS